MKKLVFLSYIFCKFFFSLYFNRLDRLFQRYSRGCEKVLIMWSIRLNGNKMWTLYDKKCLDWSCDLICTSFEGFWSGQQFCRRLATVPTQRRFSVVAEEGQGPTAASSGSRGLDQLAPAAGALGFFRDKTIWVIRSLNEASLPGFLPFVHQWYKMHRFVVMGRTLNLEKKKNYYYKYNNNNK